MKEIFGDANLDPHAALYGDHLIKEIKDWITTTDIPVLLGFNLSPAQIPGITINLAGSQPEQSYVGDAGLIGSHALKPDEIAVIVPKFVPASITPSADGTFITIVLPDSLTDDQKQLVMPGLIIRDKNNLRYNIGENQNNPTVYPIENGALLSRADLSEIEVVSPFTDYTYREGSMLYNEEVLVTVHGHSQRTEGIWLWAIVQWGILKFRPILTSVYGLDLALPMASDFMKDDSFMGDNVWRRFITLSAKSVWSWEGPKRQDMVAFLLSIKATQNSDLNPNPSVTQI